MTKKLQITVDDGPDTLAIGLDGPEKLAFELALADALDKILAEIKTRSVKAAFFNLGQEVKGNPTATKKIHDEGHVLGNHSWDHLMPSTSDYNDAQIKKQFKGTHDEVVTATAYVMKHWRAPRGERITELNNLLSGNGNLYQLTHCDWHADSKDARGETTADGMLAAIRTDIADQSGRTNFRLLFHVKPTTATVFKAVLDGLVSDGHTIVDFTQTS